MDSHLITHFHVAILVLTQLFSLAKSSKINPNAYGSRHFENRMTKFRDLKIWDQNRMRQNRELKLHLSVIKPFLHLN
jgi:hypothetical protein